MAFSLEQAAEMVGVVPGLILRWVIEKKVQPFFTLPFGLTNQYFFDEASIQTLSELAKQSVKSAEKPVFIDDGTQENFTVAQLASLWRLSPDTIRRVFENEPDVIKLGNKNPRGKRRRVTLRIPREVAERVRKRMSNL